MKKAVLLLTLFAMLVTGSVVTAAPPSQATDGESYVVQPGDWLMKIAEKFYGDANAYRVIVEATNAKAAEDASFAVIDNPSLIRVGQKLWIPAPQVATEVIAYVPPVPSETQDGYCWTNFLNSPYSWSCMLDSQIFEPCLTAADGATIVCNIDPLDESKHFALNLTEPLPEPQEARSDAPVSWMTWLLELNDGVICGLFSGASIGFDEKRVNYGCTDGTDILGDPQPGTVWTVEQIAVGHNEDGFFIEKSEIVPVIRAWQPGNPTPAGKGLTLEALQNAVYQGIYDEPVQLTDGRYEGEPFVPGGASRPTVTFHPEVYAFGDLSGDGVDDAAVILIENSGGSGSFIYLAAVISEGGAPVNVATQFVSDREQVQAISIDGNEITVDTVSHGLDDPMCCPTQEATKVYQLEDDQLVEVLVALEDTLWTLVSYGDPSNPQGVLEDSEITAEFDSAEGTVNGSAGCNNYFGSYEVDGETITFDPLGSTMMACPEPEGIMDQETAYLAALGSAVTYHIEGDRLEMRNADGALVLQFTAKPTAVAAGEAYVVQPGDWLTKIAKNFYGDANAYRVIVEATNAKAAEDASFAVIDNPSLIRVGQKLWIPAQPGSLTLAVLQNASYQGIYNELVQLTDGQYEGEPFVPGGASRPTVTFHPEVYAFGDLNGDGVDDAAVILIENSGGSGSFIYLAAVISEGGAPVNVATQFVSDREQVQAIIIEDGEITLNMVTHGPDDPMCCPTQEVTKRYQLQGDQLVEL